MELLTKLQKYTDYSLGKSKEKLEIKYEDTSFDNLTFIGFDMNNTEFLEVIFTNCDFSDVYLSGSNLSGSTFEKCIFKRNMFRKGKAEYVTFNRTMINGLDSFRSSLYQSEFHDMIINDSLMKNCFIARATFSNIIFKNTDLTDANFNYSKFSNVKFINCILNGTKFENTLGFEKIEFL